MGEAPYLEDTNYIPVMDQSMEDRTGLMDEPTLQSLPIREHINTALLFFLLAFCVGALAFLAYAWLAETLWMKGAILLGSSVLGLGILIASDLLPRRAEFFTTHSK